MTLARSGAGSATHGLGLAPAAGATGAPAGSFLAGSPIDVGRPYLGAVRAQWRFAALFVVFVLVGSSAALAGEPSGSASLPPWVVLAVALVAALLVAPGVALLAELLGPRRVRGDGDLVDALDAPVVARIPRERPVRAPWRRLRRRRRRSRRAPADVPAGTGGGDDGAGAATEPADPAADAPDRADVRHDEVWAAYRRLAVLLEFAQPPRRSFMVVASSDDDGATSVVEHLARELATPGNPVTVVDLGDRADAADVVREGAAGGGYVLVDSPPLLESTEALRLAADVDAVLVVARQGRTTRADLTRTRELLDTAGVPSAGSVLLDARG